MISIHAPTIFLALEPDAETVQRVRRYKEQVRRIAGEQLYLDDPPHMTLFLAVFPEAGPAIDVARAISEEAISPQLTLAGWHVFMADPLTGRNTLVIDFDEPSRDQLRSIQNLAVRHLAPHRDAAATLHSLRDRLPGLLPVQRAAVERDGFPFLGADWHPHLTIASIEPRDWSVVEAKLLGEPPLGFARCARIVAYELIDGRPEELAAFALGGQNRSASKPPSAENTVDISSLKQELNQQIWEVVERHEWILSATITGSFLTDQTLCSISDIDLVLVLDRLNQSRFQALQEEFSAALQPVLTARGLNLLINTTLGPRKLNADDTAVLHLMLYSREGHHQHAIKSPFTCLDWQRSSSIRKRSLAAIYPVFALQPHHFVSSRRGLRDYLHDFERGVVSYRELECSESGYSELAREEPMATRDRYEYAYHVMRFLMQNLLKLVRRRNAAPDGDLLLREFFTVFPQHGATYGPLYLQLRERKKARDFSVPIVDLQEKLRQFVLDFESQFRVVFHETATRHVVFRHAATKMNNGVGDQRRFLGRLDPGIQAVAEEELGRLIETVSDFSATSAFVSPLLRCRQSLDLLATHLGLPPIRVDERLAEIDYGACDGLTIADARGRFAALFEAWQRGEDARFPDGENSADVQLRINSFAADVWQAAEENTITCTHNVVLRCLVGHEFGVPECEWHRISIPHLAPITVVQTHEFGRFVDLDETVERTLFADFLHRDAA